ncbi:hypothetical protein ACFQU2_41010 [Siccirubricoccus deserti]
MRGLPLLVLLLLALSGPARAQPEATPAAGRESDMDTLCSLPGWLSGGGTAGNPGVPPAPSPNGSTSSGWAVSGSTAT